MPDPISELLKELKQTNLYLKLIASKAASIESELVTSRLQRESTKKRGSR